MSKNKVRQDFITKWVLNPNWPREMKLFMSLEKTYPHSRFWETLDLGFTINSLAFFKTEKGSELIHLKYQDFIKYIQNGKTTNK